MPEYEKYIERRERVHAAQLLDVSQAPWFARQFGFPSPRWSLDVGLDGDFSLRITPRDQISRTMSRGDYLVESDGDYPKIVSYAEFRQKWEPENA